MTAAGPSSEHRPVLVAAVALVALGALIVALTWGGDDPGDGSASPPPSTVGAVVPASPDVVLADVAVTPEALGAPLDDFEREGAPLVDTSSSGTPWTAVGGAWRTNGIDAVPGDSDPADGDAFVLVDLGGRSGVVAGRTGQKVAQGSALLFWYETPNDYWSLEPSPRVGTWAVRRIANGTQVLRETVGLSTTQPGTLVGVVLTEVGLDVWIGGASRLHVDHVPAAGATGAGLVGFMERPGGRWADVWAFGAG